MTSTEKGMQLNEVQDDQSSNISITMRQSEMTSGPLPHPELLREYDALIKDGAERIMQMAERQQEHRFEIEKSVTKDNKRGQWMGWSLTLLFIGVGTWVTLVGHEAVGVAIFGGSIASIIALFVARIKIR